MLSLSPTRWDDGTRCGLIGKTNYAGWLRAALRPGRKTRRFGRFENMRFALRSKNLEHILRVLVNSAFVRLLMKLSDASKSLEERPSKTSHSSGCTKDGCSWRSNHRVLNTRGSLGASSCVLMYSNIVSVNKLNIINRERKTWRNTRFAMSRFALSAVS